MFDDDFLDQLKQTRHHHERWLTPEGIALKDSLIPALRADGWESLLVGFPYADGVSGGKDLRHLDLSGMDLSSGRFAGACLTGANLAGCTLDGSDFSGSDLRATKLPTSHCHDADFSGSMIYGTDFRGGDFTRSRFPNLEMSAALFDGANLSACNFSGSKLQAVSMTKAILDGADLSSCNASQLDLVEAKARGANFSRSSLVEANLARADLRDANFTLARMGHCSLWNAALNSAVLEMTDLIRADLSYAQLDGASLSGADLTSAQLMKARLISANMDGCIACWANLSEADLTNASARGVDFRHALLVGANLSGTVIASCAIYGISVWGVTTSPATVAKDLVISSDTQPFLTIDDLEIAQFVHMITSNEKVAKAIDAMRTKVVLLLGTFDDATKATLDELKLVLRRHNFVPIVFDFEKPESQRLIETVRTLALLSSLVIVDLSRPGGQLVELGIVDNTRVPFATIRVEGASTTTMLDALADYYWYRSEPFSYPSGASGEVLEEIVLAGVIPWASETWDKLRRT